METNVEYIRDVFYDHTGFIIGIALILLCCSLIFGGLYWDRRASFHKYLEHRREIRVQRGIQMGVKKKAAREAYLKQLVADGITDRLEEAWLAGKATREEVNAIYRAIGKTHNIPDLVPHMDPATLKSMIKGRRSRGAPAAGQEHPNMGPPPTPEPDPTYKPNTVSNVVNATKRFGEKALSRLKSA